MRTITLARQPLSEASVAANVLKHGTGAINVDACRIAAGGEVVSNHSRSAGAARSKGIYGDSSAQGTHQTAGQKLGRWPSNMILLHRPGCWCAGTGRVRGIGGGASRTAPNKVYGKWGRFHPSNHADADGTEVVDVWECVEDCPVLDLDEQSIAGGMHGAGHRRKAVVDSTYAASSYDMSGPRPMDRFGDTGGASRFYKQFQQERGMDLPQDLIDYLHLMITPEGGETLVALDLSTVDWTQYEDQQLHGLIARGDPTPYLDEVWRVLKPGAHVMLIAPEEQPTGHTGTCALEDRGFEIRDSILVVDEPGKIHYVPKAPAKERHAGCAHLAQRRKEQGPIFDLIEDLDEDAHSEVLDALAEAGIAQDVLDNIEEVGLQRDLIPKGLRKHFRIRPQQKDTHGNNHPTVKPKGVLKRLLADVPEGATVLDPFMGSGSMGLACLETGHNYVGIEKEADYVEIADARIRHWDAAQTGWKRAEIVSEAPQRQEAEEVNEVLDDLFGF